MMMSSKEDSNRRMLRARDAIDRAFDQPLDVPALADIAFVSEAHFSRVFKATFGETPHRYLQRRRIERAAALLRDTDQPVIDICTAVGFDGLSTFTRTFTAIMGETPAAHRAHDSTAAVPSCFEKAWRRPADQTLRRPADQTLRRPAEVSSFGTTASVESE